MELPLGVCKGPPLTRGVTVIDGAADLSLEHYWGSGTIILVAREVGDVRSPTSVADGSGLRVLTKVSLYARVSLFSEVADHHLDELSVLYTFS